MLEGDRTRRQEAEEHARRAIWLAGRAKDITRLSRMFEHEEYEHEDIVLWHQMQLARINKALGSELPFDESDRAAVLRLQKGIKSLFQALDDSRETSFGYQEELADLRASLTQTEDKCEANLAELATQHKTQLESLQHASRSELAKLRSDSGKQLDELKTKYESELSGEARKREALERQRREAEQRFTRVESLFKPHEASVSRTGTNLRLDVHGFEFPPGEATIGSANFGLLDRIVSAIRTFPGNRIRIGGHTDSVGSDSRNLQLSVGRAAAVKQFVVEVGGIEPARVESEGHGETRPIASNDTKDGRAHNRRVEILIINQ